MSKNIIFIIISFVAILIIAGCIPTEPQTQEELEAQTEQGAVAGQAVAGAVSGSAICTTSTNRCRQNVDGTVTWIKQPANLKTGTKEVTEILKDSCSTTKPGQLLQYTCPNGVVKFCTTTCPNGCEPKGNSALCIERIVVVIPSVVELSACGDPPGGWQENTRYVLTQNINFNFQGLACFQPTVGNIILDGNRHNLIGPGYLSTAVAILIQNKDGVVVTNFAEISGFTTAIEVLTGRQTLILNNQITNSFKGMYIAHGTDTIVSGNILNRIAQVGIESYDGQRTQLIGNTIQGISGDLVSAEDVLSPEEAVSPIKSAIYSHNGNGFRIERNTIQNNFVNAIELVDSTQNNIRNNIILGNTGRGGILLRTSPKNTVVGNTIQQNTANGIELTESEQNIINNNIISGNRGVNAATLATGIMLKGSSKNNFTANTIELNDYGVSTSGANPSIDVRMDNNVICGNRITDFSCVGLNSRLGSGNLINLFNSCPANSWPVQGVNYNPCIAR